MEFFVVFCVLRGIVLSHSGLCKLCFSSNCLVFTTLPLHTGLASRYCKSWSHIHLTLDSGSNLEAGVRKPTGLSLLRMYQYLPLVQIVLGVIERYDWQTYVIHVAVLWPGYGADVHSGTALRTIAAGAPPLVRVSWNCPFQLKLIYFLRSSSLTPCSAASPGLQTCMMSMWMAAEPNHTAYCGF